MSDNMRDPMDALHPIVARARELRDNTLRLRDSMDALPVLEGSHTALVKLREQRSAQVGALNLVINGAVAWEQAWKRLVAARVEMEAFNADCQHHFDAGHLQALGDEYERGVTVCHRYEEALSQYYQEREYFNYVRAQLAL